MTATYIQETINTFYNRLDNVERQLQNFSLGLDNKKNAAERSVTALKNQSEKLGLKLPGTSSGDITAVQRAAIDTVLQTRKVINNCATNIKEYADSQEFINKNEKYLVAMIFGQVKVGKSSLGNFIAGKYFVDAPFDNEYKKREHPPFVEEKSGRDGNITVDEFNRKWFTEGYTDTTGAIQYFTLSGLRWFDSPGTGAVKREGDVFTDDNIQDMTSLVDKYIAYTDMGVFLMNSSEPGLQVDMQYIRKMKELDKDTLVVITKSDRSERVKINGKYGKDRVLRAKLPENRKQQEDSITNDIDKQYNIGAKYIKEKFKVLSISTKLAANAIAQQDDDMFKESNLDQFMNIISKIATEEVIELKQKNPRSAFNHFIDTVVNGENGKGGLSELERLSENTLTEIEVFKNDIAKRTTKLQRLVSSKAKREVQKKSFEWDEEINNTGKEITAAELSMRISKITEEVLKKELSEEIGDIIADFEIKQVHGFNIQMSEGIKLEKQTIKQKYKEYVREERSPDGIIEHIKSFFGKTYYRMVAHDREKEVVVNIGTNIDSIYDKLDETITQNVKTVIATELNAISENYFKPQETYANEMKELLTKTKDELKLLKFAEKGVTYAVNRQINKFM